MIDEQPRSATIVANEPTETFVLGRAQFLRFVEANPELAIQILRVLPGRLRDANEFVQDAIFLDVSGRLAKKSCWNWRTAWAPHVHWDRDLDAPDATVAGHHGGRDSRECEQAPPILPGARNLESIDSGLPSFGRPSSSDASTKRICRIGSDVTTSQSTYMLPRSIRGARPNEIVRPYIGCSPRNDAVLATSHRSNDRGSRSQLSLNREEHSISGGIRPDGPHPLTPVGDPLLSSGLPYPEVLLAISGPPT